MVSTETALSGTITFLFTDIQGSTRLWEQWPEAMADAHGRHQRLIQAAVAGNGGTLVRERGEGDSTFSVFAGTPQALAAVLQFQLALAAEVWPAEAALRVRAALHTGQARVSEDDYNSSAVNRCARLRAIAWGGQTVLSQATYELVRDEPLGGASFLDLGTHRLQDLARPEHVFQLVHPDLPRAFPAVRSLDTIPNNLPQQLTSFVGREREMVEVREALMQSRLVTLTGAGGAGKTRLALQSAADVLSHFPDGIWLAELAPLSNPALVAQTVAGTLRVREESGRGAAEALADHLKGRTALLLLDNCEHVLDAAAGLADALLRACPDVRVLATSREALGVPGEWVYRVPSLPAPDARQSHTADALSQYDAVRLFIDRAVLGEPSFQVTNGNAPAVAQICDRLDGIPLAIELAASRVRTLSPDQIAARLDDRFRLLTGGPRTALPRQQTLKAAIDWGHDLLTDEEKTLLRRLSVFAGGWTLEDAEAVCADPDEEGRGDDGGGDVGNAED